MQEVLNFLSELKVNNNKEWFDQNRKRYEESRKKVLFLTELIIHEINKFDPEIGNQNPKDCVFRIFRDVRFSPDKTPYKINMGSFIAKGGRKSVVGQVITCISNPEVRLLEVGPTVHLPIR